MTSLDARNSLLMDRTKSNEDDSFPFAKRSTVGSAPLGSARSRGSSGSISSNSGYLKASSQSRPLTPSTPFVANQSRENLVINAAPLDREPTIPNLGEFGSSRPYQGSYGPGIYSSYAGARRY